MGARASSVSSRTRSSAQLERHVIYAVHGENLRHAAPFRSQ